MEALQFQPQTREFQYDLFDGLSITCGMSGDEPYFILPSTQINSDKTVSQDGGDRGTIIYFGEVNCRLEVNHKSVSVVTKPNGQGYSSQVFLGKLGSNCTFYMGGESRNINFLPANHSFDEA